MSNQKPGSKKARRRGASVPLIIGFRMLANTTEFPNRRIVLVLIKDGTVAFGGATAALASQSSPSSAGGSATASIVGGREALRGAFTMITNPGSC